MALKQQAYDHAAYTIPVTWCGNTTSSAATSAKFMAFTSMLLKSVTVAAFTCGTSGGTGIANGFVAINVIKGGTATNSYVVTTYGTAGAGFSLGTNTATNTVVTSTAISLAQGDLVYFTQGTDAALAATFAAEMYILPGANLTV